ncbi:zinc ribbon domain-containing protein, partial [Methylogaea oryzae]
PKAWAAGLARRLLETPERVSPLEFRARAAAFVFFAAWGWQLAWLDIGNGAIGASFVHNILLPFHEAGHVLFRPFGEFVTYLGGTLGQLLMPVVLGVALIRERRDNFGAALALWLLGASLLDVAPYVYDALDPQLMLLSGLTGKDGDHDWIYLLGSTGLLRQAQTLGRATRWAGIVTLLCAGAW